MSSFYEQFFAQPMAERQRIADYAGLSLAYIHKHTYTQQRAPRFHFHNAALLDRASNGQLCFLDTTEGEIDWGYVLERLLVLRRLGRVQRGRIVAIPTAQFETFWQLYPRKVNRHGAHKVWRQLNLDFQIAPILTHLSEQIATLGWESEPTHAPVPVAFLQRGTWRKPPKEAPTGA